MVGERGPSGAGPAAPLRRVVVLGTSCSGKSVLARRLGAALGVPVVHLDELSWLPGWRERPVDEFRHLTAEAVRGDAWVVDGNAAHVRDLVWTRATHALWLDYPFALIALRALTRTVRRVSTGQIVCAGNRETFRHAFLSRDSILSWVVRSYRRNRRAFARLAASDTYPDLTWIRARRPADAEAVLAAVRPAPPPVERDAREGSSVRRR